MMAELCYHIIDLVQNSVAARAQNIIVHLEESLSKDMIMIEVKDDGKGMDAETMANVQNPFYTTKGFKKVGLGIPLFKDTSLMCDGQFYIDSTPGLGTTLRATFKRSHIDTPPLGDVRDTLLTLLIGTCGGCEIKPGEPYAVNLAFIYTTDIGSFRISLAEIRAEIGELPLTHPDVLAFLRGYITENIDQLNV